MAGSWSDGFRAAVKEKKNGGSIMCEKIATAEMSRGEWLRLRKTGLGGSDAGAVCGLNPYSSPVKVFRDKTCVETEEQIFACLGLCRYSE